MIARGAWGRGAWGGILWGGADAIDLSQTSSPSSIPSAASWGGPQLVYDQDVSPGSIPSASSWGSPTIIGPQTSSPASILSPSSWGSPVVAGPVSPASIPSASSWGSPTINAQQTVSPGSIASTAAFGSPVVSRVKTVSPGSIPSAASWGSPLLTGVIRPVFPGSILSPSSWGGPVVFGGEQELQVFVGGYDRTAYVIRGSSKLQSQTLGRWTGSIMFENTQSGDPLLVDTSEEWAPQFGQTILIKEFGRTLFRGCIKKLVATRPLSTNLVYYTCTLGDKSSICDHRAIREAYPDVSQGLAQWDIADVIRDIVAKYLDGEGIAVDPSMPASLGDLTAPLSPFISVTQAFDNITAISGLQWFVDLNQTLIFTDTMDATAAPFEITEDSQNWRNLTATISDEDFRTNQYVISNAKIIPEAPDAGSGTGSAPSKVETYTMIDSGTGDPVIPDHTGLQNATTPPGYVYVNFPISTVVGIKVNGVAVTVYDPSELTDSILGGMDQSWWTFYRSITANTSFVESRSYLAPGDVVEVTYIPPTSAVAASAVAGDLLVVEVPSDPPAGESFGTCGSGRYDAVEQVNDVNTQAGMDAIAAGILNRSNVIPKQVDLETDHPGLQVGQSITVNVPRQLLAGPGGSDLLMFITALTGQSNPSGTDLGYESSFRWQVTAMNFPDVGNWVKDWERLWRRTQHPVPVDRVVAATVVLAPGTALQAGVNFTNPGKVNETGQLSEIVARFQNPPVDQDLVIDLFINGVSILDSAKLVVPAGMGDDVLLTTFAIPVIWLYKNDTLTVRVSYRVTGPNPVAARSGTVVLRTLA